MQIKQNLHMDVIHILVNSFCSFHLNLLSRKVLIWVIR